MRVVNRYKEPYTHYIGRPSVFGNPYALVASVVPGTKRVATLGESLRLFEDYARNDSDVKAAIMRLPLNAVLGCTCKPKDCHGDVIVRLWYEWRGVPYVEEPNRKRLL